MTGILPSFLLSTHLWAIHPESASGYALELAAQVFSKVPRTEAKPMPTCSLMDAAGLSTASEGQKVMVIPIKGVIIPKSDSWYGLPGLDWYQARLQEGMADDSVAGFVFDIDSPGGSAMQLAEFADFLATSITKPKVGYISGLACSAAMYIACPLDYIISTRFSGIIGNIGTVYRSLELTPMLEKWGAKYLEVYGKEAVDKDLGFKEALAGKTDKLRDMLVQPSQDQFLADVEKYRPSVAQEARTGAVYFPAKAQSVGLIDGVGGLSDAVSKVLELANSTKTKQTSSNNTMGKITITSVLQAFGIGTKAQTDEDLTLDDAAALKAKADAVLGLEAKVTELTAANETLTKEKAAADSKISDLESKTKELQAKVDAGYANPPAAPKASTTDDLEPKDDASGKMEGEDAFLAAHGY